jgi:hypothetical protein
MLLDNQPPSDDNTEVERITRKSKMYHLIDGILYQRGTNGMMMKCVDDQIWHGWENRMFWFPISDSPVLAVLG